MQSTKSGLWSIVVFTIGKKKKKTHKWTCTVQTHVVQVAAVYYFYLSVFSKAVQFREKVQSLRLNDSEKDTLQTL